MRGRKTDSRAPTLYVPLRASNPACDRHRTDGIRPYWLHSRGNHGHGLQRDFVPGLHLLFSRRESVDANSVHFLLLPQAVSPAIPTPKIYRLFGI